VGLEDDYRSYREVIAVSIQILCPRAEVVTASLDAIKEEVRRFNPHLVICSRPVTPAMETHSAGWSFPWRPLGRR
jgi:hypothetical protein